MQFLTMSIFSSFSNSFLSRHLSFNPLPTTTHSMSNPNSTTATTPSSSPHLISPTQSDRPIISFNPFNFELENQMFPIFVENHNDGLLDWKQISEAVQTVGLGGVGVSITLIVNPPAAADTHRALYMSYLMSVCLGLFMSMGLSFLSVVMKGSSVIGWAQKRLIFFTLFFVVMACFLRFHLALPLDDIGFGIASLLIGIVVMVLYLWLGWRCHRHMHDK